LKHLHYLGHRRAVAKGVSDLCAQAGQMLMLGGYVDHEIDQGGLSPCPTACFNGGAEFDLDLLTTQHATRGQKRITMLLIVMKNR
jgi:hypothetical protein